MILIELYYILEEFIEKECDYVSEIASEYIDSEIGNELLEDNKPLFDLHKKLTEEEGFDAQSDEYYTEIDKRMRLDFPHKFGKTETTASTKPTQTVASAKRSVNNKSQKTVRLTPSQVTIAKKLGVPLELYAKQLNITKER